MADRVVSYDFRGNFTSLTAGLAASGRAVQDLGTKLTALDRNGAKMRAGLTQVGASAGRMGLVAAAGLAAVIAVSANFEQAMSKVAATGEDARASFDELRQAAIDAGAATAFSASEAAAGIENLLKAGVSAKDVLAGGLGGALDLAAAGGLEVADAAEIAATALTQFKLSGKDVPHVADLLAAGAGKAQGEVSDLAMALKQSGLVASQMGVSIEETTGTLAAFASAGLLGSDAGTSFRTMLLRLANPTQESASLMQELGIQAYDAQGNFVGMASVAEQLKVAFEGKTQAERDSALATIFGSDAIRAASVLYEQGAAGVDGWTNKVNDAGYAAETAGIRLDNLKGDLEALKGSLETALIGSGDGSTGILREMTQGITNLINAYNGLPGAAKNAVTGLLGITAVLGGGLWFTAKVVNGIANAKQSLSDLGITAGRTGGQLGNLARTVTPILAVAGAVTVLGNELAEATGAKIKVSDLQRDLEALAGGRNSELFSRITNDMQKLGSSMGSVAEPVYEAATAFGIFGDTGLDNSKDNIEAIDQALAAMVESGNAGQAAAIFEEFAAAAAGGTPGASVSDDAWNDALSALNAYQTALGNEKAVADEAADANSNLAGAIDEATAATFNFSDALAGLEGYFNRRQAVRDYADALKEFKKGLENGFTRKDAERIDDVGRSIAQLAQKMKEGPRQAFLKDEIANLRELANNSGPKAKAEIGELIAQLKKLVAPKPIKPEVQSAAAINAIQNIKNALAGIRDETVFVHVQRTGSDIDAPGVATGGYIRGPGSTTSDSIPAYLSDKEFVVNAAAVQRYGVGFMHNLNAQKFAAGGLVGSTYSSSRGGVANPEFAGFLASMHDLRSIAAQEYNLREADLRKTDDQFKRILEKREERAKKEADADKAKLDAMLDAQKQFEEQVAGLFKTDVFAKGDSNAVAVFPDGSTINLGAAIGDLTPEDYLNYTSQGATIQSNSGFNPVGNLEGDNDRLRQAIELYEQLQARGFDGPAFRELVGRADVEALQYYANLPRAELAQIERLFEQRDHLAGQAGSIAGNDFDKAIGRLERKYDRSNAIAENLNTKIDSLNTKVGHLTATVAALPKPIGSEVGAALNGVARDGARGRPSGSGLLPNGNTPRMP